MNRSFSTIAMVLLTSFVIPFASVDADCNVSDSTYCTCDDSCDPCIDPCRGYELGADFILWRPSIDDLDYAVLFESAANNNFPTLSDTNTAKYYFVEPNWEPGLRAYLGKRNIWCGWDLMGSYTYLSVRERDTFADASPGTLFSTLFHPAISFAGNPSSLGSGNGFKQLSSKYRLIYKTFNVLLSYECCMCRGHYVRPFFGLAGVFFDQKIESAGIEIETPLDDMKWKGDYWGVGVECGTEYKYALCERFGFYARCSGTIITGWSESDRRDRFDICSSTPTVQNFRSDDECLFVNGYHVATGLFYKDCWCDWRYTFRFGYEFMKWNNTLTPRRYDSANIAQIGLSGPSSTTTMGFHGIFIALSVDL